MSGISIHEIDGVELLGGAVRMPKLKSTLDDYFSEAIANTPLPPPPVDTDTGVESSQNEDHGDQTKSNGTTPSEISAPNEKTPLVVGQHLNGDEAMALGAAFRAANLSTSFRVRKVGMWDTSQFGVSVELVTLEDDKNKAGAMGGFFGGLMGGKKKVKNADMTGESESAWHKKTGLWGRKTLLPAKSKTVAITHDQVQHMSLPHIIL